MTAEAQKRKAAETALKYLPDEGVVGLGTGSTARYFIEGVARCVAEGRKLKAVATSAASRHQAEAAGIEVLPDAGPWTIDVCVDGADEVSAELDLIKGGGGCHVRELIVNCASRRNVIIVDESKMSEKLGKKWPIPIELLPFGFNSVSERLQRWGRVERRLTAEGQPWVTDSGNSIVDLHCGVVSNPRQMATQLLSIAGVVGTGLFVGRADVVLVASSKGVLELCSPTGGLPSGCKAIDV